MSLICQPFTEAKPTAPSGLSKGCGKWYSTQSCEYKAGLQKEYDKAVAEWQAKFDAYQDCLNQQSSELAKNGGTNRGGEGSSSGLSTTTILIGVAVVVIAFSVGVLVWFSKKQS